MGEPITIYLSGRNPEIWNRISSKLTGIIEGAVDSLMADVDDEEKAEAVSLGKDIANLATNWIHAKLERPEIENELKLIEIAKRIEEIKQLQVQRKLVEVQLERKKLELWEQRIIVVLNCLSFFNKYLTRDKDGNVVLILTDQQFVDFKSGFKFLMNGD